MSLLPNSSYLIDDKDIYVEVFDKSKHSQTWL